jgi:prophage antirepressor-like protein
MSKEGEKVNEIRVFSNTEFGELRVLTINGKDYFPASACAKMLGYENPRKAVIDHCKGVTKRDTPTEGGVQSINYIPEGDLYRLIVSSRLPAAEKFERWVFDEVLPSIRRQGGYGDVAAIVTQAVQAAVGEMVKQLIPLLQPREPEGPSRRVRRRHAFTDVLDAEIRQEIEDMILSKRYTYLEIAAYLREQYGISVSKSSIGRYAQRLYDQIDGIVL